MINSTELHPGGLRKVGTEVPGLPNSWQHLQLSPPCGDMNSQRPKHL